MLAFENGRNGPLIDWSFEKNGVATGLCDTWMVSQDCKLGEQNLDSSDAFPVQSLLQNNLVFGKLVKKRKYSNLKSRRNKNLNPSFAAYLLQKSIFDKCSVSR